MKFKVGDIIKICAQLSPYYDRYGIIVHYFEYTNNNYYVVDMPTVPHLIVFTEDDLKS